MFKRVPATATYFTAIRGAVETATQRRWTITAGALRSADQIPVFLSASAQRPSANWHIAVLPGAISRLCSVSWRQIPVWATDTPPHTSGGASAFRAAESLHDFISQNITPDMTRSISFNKIRLHSLCLVNRGKSVFLGTTFPLHYVQKFSTMEACV